MGTYSDPGILMYFSPKMLHGICHYRDKDTVSNSAHRSATFSGMGMHAVATVILGIHPVVSDILL